MVLEFFSYCIYAVCPVSSAWIKILIPQCYAATTRSGMTPVINVLLNLFITIENSYQNIVLRSDSSCVSIPGGLQWTGLPRDPMTPSCSQMRCFKSSRGTHSAFFLRKWFQSHLKLIKLKSQGSPQWWPYKLDGWWIWADGEENSQAAFSVRGFQRFRVFFPKGSDGGLVLNLRSSSLHSLKTCYLHLTY